MRQLVILPITAMLIGCSHPANEAMVPSPVTAKLVPVARCAHEMILDAILRDVVTNPDLQDERNFYGMPYEKHIALVSNPGYGVPWPESYRPQMDGFTVHRVREDAEGREDQPRMLGVRIDKMNLEQRDCGLYNSPIEVTILNGGGTRDGIVGGGCSVYYSPRSEGERWTVTSFGTLDP